MTDDLIGMVFDHVVRRHEKAAPLAAYERTDVQARMYGVERDGVTMAELLRSARPEHPELLRRLVALTAMTYRRGTGGGGAAARTTASLHPRSSGRGVEYGPAVSGFPLRWLTDPPRPPTQSRVVDPSSASARALGVCDYR
jgi:hypothetical protein